MKFSRLIVYLKYYGQFIPFRFNFIVFLSLIYFSVRWIRQAQTDTSSYSDLIFLMAKITLIFTSMIILLSLLSCLVCFLYFLILKQQKGSSMLEIKMDLDSNKQHLLRVQTRLPFALKPLLGFVKVRLVYDKTHMTDAYILAGRIKKQFFAFNSGLAGNNALVLPDIKEYHFSNALIYFEDMLQFFSFTTQSSINTSLCNLPQSLLRDTAELPPKKTEEELIRIEQLRKVEGELLNYKKFEDSDDVRRIVWKLFAKNKELVVRVPEIIDPFASHIYMYASFYNTHATTMHSEYHEAMSNHFKNCVWSIYDALSKKDWVVRYIADQTIHQSNADINPTQYTVALSNWHQDKTLSDYFKPKQGSVLCIHSFTSVKELEQLLSECDSHTHIFFIQLSKIFKSYYLLHWALRIFIKPKNDRLQSLRNQWVFNPLKYQCAQQEKALLTTLQKANIHFEII